MSTRADPPFDPSQPALIVTYGSTCRKHRVLDRDVLVIGQHRNCDLELASPEIAPVHCLVIRGPDGWRMRDCGSRIGTRLNGKRIQEAPLCDSDALQIGPFSFQAHLPPVDSLAKPAVDPATTPDDPNESAGTLGHRLRDCEVRETRLEESEHNLASDRARLDQELSAFRAELERSKHAGADAQHLDLRQQELDHYARHLKRACLALKEEEAQLTRVSEDQERQRASIAAAEANLRSQRQDLARMITELHELHHAVRAREETALQQLRQENAQLRQEMIALVRSASEGTPALTGVSG
jgi:pSer/pThr/pTyr-binding forkhead associated (FHA) protein